MKNPFSLENLNTSNLFFKRDREESILIKNIKLNRHTLISGNKKIGKTSLLQSFLRKNDDYIPIIINLNSVINLHDVKKRMLTTIIRQSNIINDIKWLLSLFSKFDLIIKNKKDEVEYSIDASKVNLSELTIKDLMFYIDAIKEKTNVIVIFDDMQDILSIDDHNEFFKELNIEINKKNIPYVFICSQCEELSQKISKKGELLVLNNINNAELYQFFQNHLSHKNIQISMNCFDSLYEKCNGNTGYIYMVFKFIWDACDSNKNINDDIINDAFISISTENSYFYQKIINNMSQIQKKAFYGFLLEPNSNFYSQDFLQTFNLKNKSQVQDSLKYLQREQIIFQKSGKFLFSDPFFHFWARKIYS